MAYGKSNGHVINNVTWPWKEKPWPQYAQSPVSRKQLEMLFSNNC